MRRIRPFLAHAAAALVVVSGIAVLPLLTSATPASATPTCTGTSLVRSAFGGPQIRVPTAGSGTQVWSCILGSGNSSNAVSRLQIDLNDCYGAHLQVDGSYGPLTKAAVKVVQAAEHVTQDGIYGPQTIHSFSYQIPGQPTGSCDRIDGA
jgi:hypothetical protein